MKRLKGIGVASVFRVSLVMGAVMGGIVGIILLIADIAGGRAMEGVVTLFLAPILYGVMGALVNAFMVFIYNRLADRLGGIELDIE